MTGNMSGNIEKASHVLVREKIPGVERVYGVCELFVQEVGEGSRYLYFFYFQQRKFYFDPNQNTFYRMKPVLEGILT